MSEPPTASPHYDGDYFLYQEENGAFGGWANVTIFQPHVSPTARVIDFGCGGGFLLAALTAAEKIGVEPNSTARERARLNGIQAYADATPIPDDWADVIISMHALEHCLHPLVELQRLHRKLRPGGRCVFVVPCETIQMRYSPKDVNYHLYSWSPMALGNLFTEAGFLVDDCGPHISQWPPLASRFGKALGHTAFDLLSKVVGHVRRSYFSVRVIARRPT